MNLDTILKELDLAILKTSTGELRNLLTTCALLIRSQPKPKGILKSVHKSTIDGVKSWSDNYAHEKIVSIVQNTNDGFTVFYY